MADAGVSLPVEVVAFVLALLVALGLFAWALYALLYGPRARMKRRLAHVAGVGGEKVKSVRDGAALKKRAIQTRIKQAEESRTTNKKGRTRLREELMQAGIRIEVSHYLAANAVGAVISGLVAALMGLSIVGCGLVAILTGIGLPKLVVTILARRRLAKFTGLFADALDVVVRGIKSGLPLGECINIVGREMSDPLGAEFRLIAEGQKLGLTLQDALERAVERMPTNELRFFAIVLIIQQQTGGNLAETLGKLSDVLRARKRMREKIKAYASEARASAGIIGSLPIIVTALLGITAPDYIGVLFHTGTGHFLLGCGLIWMGSGVLVMRQMINFDI